MQACMYGDVGGGGGCGGGGFVTSVRAYACVCMWEVCGRYVGVWERMRVHVCMCVSYMCMRKYVNVLISYLYSLCKSKCPPQSSRLQPC